MGNSSRKIQTMTVVRIPESGKYPLIMLLPEWPITRVSLIKFGTYCLYFFKDRRGHQR